jgi:galactose mutarotase-like enzyme
VRPELGGRITSLKYKGKTEWIAQPRASAVPRNIGDNFIRPEIGGWDEMVPTTEACVSLDGRFQLPDHGEVWARAWEVMEQEDKSLSLAVELTTRALRLERVIFLNGNQLRLDYRITNIGAEMTPVFWSAHPLFSGQQITQVKISPKRSLIQTAPSTPEIPQSFIPANLTTGTSVEYWAEPELKVSSVEIFNSQGESLRMRWDTNVIPYFGIFINNGEFGDFPAISPQPSLAHRVSERIAEAAGLIPLLAPGQHITFSLNLELGG